MNYFFRRSVTRWARPGAICVAALFFFSTTRVSAQSAAPREVAPALPGYGERPFHLEVVTGVATAVGLLGVRGEFNLGEPLSLGVGGGTNGVGPDWEVHARWRIIHGVHREKLYSALTLEAAFARARYEGFDLDLGLDCDNLDPNGGCYSPPVVPQTVNWGQAELGWEMMARSGFTLRASSGFARELGSYRWQCKALDELVPCGAGRPSDTLFVFSLALGYAF